MSASNVPLSFAVVAIFFVVCASASSPAPVDCKYSQWTSVSECSKPCGGGSYVQTRTVQAQALDGGVACTDFLKRVRACNTQACACSDKVLKAFSDDYSREVHDILRCSEGTLRSTYNRSVVISAPGCNDGDFLQAAASSTTCTKCWNGEQPIVYEGVFTHVFCQPTGEEPELASAFSP